jgi:UDP-N-acetyl-2-amino-2-deoxyglucuronate dehydrogenase
VVTSGEALRQSTASRVTAAIVGCGDISVVHQEAVRAMAALGQARLVAVCDTNVAAAERAGQRFGAPAFVEHRSMLAAVRPDVVHVCTPHDQHVVVVLDCLAAGSHVLLEKPLAHEVSQAQMIVDAAARHPDLKVGVCLQNRYNATVQRVRALLDSGELGEIVGASASVVWHRTPEYYRTSPWRGQKRRSGGGVLINQAIHTIDLLQWLLGDVHRVAGHTTRALAATAEFDIDVEDTAHLIFDHTGGARSVLFATVAGAVDFPVSLEIVTKGAVLFIRGDLTVTRVDGRVEKVMERQAESAGRSYWGVSHSLLISDFYRTLPEPHPFWIGPEQAMAALRILTQVT